MPSSATITAFYNFSANTKARASQVNTNFDVFRGHIIPVHPSTSTASDNTYNLGSADYRWSALYIDKIYKTYAGQTTAASQSGFAKTAIITLPATTSSTPVSGSTITIYGSGGPVEVSFCNGSTLSVATSYSLGMWGQTSGGLNPNRINLSLYKDNVEVVAWYCNVKFTGTGLAIDPYGDNHIFSSSLKYITILNNTTATFHLQAYLSNSLQAWTNINSPGSLYAKELI